MRKLFSILLILLICSNTAFCEDPVITMATSNKSFPDFINTDVLKTNNTKISGVDVSVMTLVTTMNIDSVFSFSIQAKTDNTKIQIDYGNGTLIDNIIGTVEVEILGTLAGHTVKIYGSGIIYLNCSFKQLSSLDVSSNTSLTGIDCSLNQLTTLNISKNVALEYISCTDNQLSTLDLSENTALSVIYCSKNQIKNLDVTKNAKLLSLDCSYNQLSSIDVSKNKKLVTFTCNDNYLTSIDVSQNNELFRLICNDNFLTFSDLPVRSMIEYRYAPQKPINLP